MADHVENGVHDYTTEKEYVAPGSPEVAKHLEWFRGLKLGLMMHWSPAAQLGVLESWPLCDGEREWSQVEVDWTADMDEFRRQYWALNRTFNPVRFQPDKLARMAKECGFQYVLFTTKHHDGFCMYDTAATDYKVTSPDCPFSGHVYADITKAVFDAFRKEGMAVSAYFSKPDWHSDFYWHRRFPIAESRNVNYDVRKHPELWDKFIEYTHRQLLELTSNYGKIDVLWLDGGWVRPENQGQDIRLEKVVEQIRATTQPHLIVCDRTVGGVYENIVTPEQSVPDRPLDVPWEACVTLGKYFSFHYEDQYKPAGEVIRIFLQIVSRGGSLALNITPRPDGAIPTQALSVLKEVGEWMAVHKEGIYHSHICSLPSEENLFYTQVEDRIYAFVLLDDMGRLPERFCIHSRKKVHSICLLRTGQVLPFHSEDGRLILDTSGISTENARYADCFIIK